MLAVPAERIGAQAVDPRVGLHRPGHGAPFPADGLRLLAAGIGNELDMVVLSGAAALFLQPADALPELVDPLGGARAAQALVHGLQRRLEPLSETRADACLLACTRLGVAVQAHLPGIRVFDPPGARTTSANPPAVSRNADPGSTT